MPCPSGHEEKKVGAFHLTIFQQQNVGTSLSGIY